MPLIRISQEAFNELEKAKNDPDIWRSCNWSGTKSKIASSLILRSIRELKKAAQTK